MMILIALILAETVFLMAITWSALRRPKRSRFVIERGDVGRPHAL